MPVVPADIATLLASRQNGTLATLRRDGRPQLSVVTYAWYPDDDGREIVRISTVDGRAKVANLRRDPRASFLVSGGSGWSYAVVEGTVELSPVAVFHDDETVEELVRVYRDAAGEHPDWADYRRAMVDDRRLVARLVVEHAYGLVRS
jgi:PPOX class probable F420-dependent enzyme